MKQPLAFFIISLFSLAINATEAFQVPDTLNLFENITDVSRQIQQQTTSKENITTPEEDLWEAIPEALTPDSIILPASIGDTIIGEPIIGEPIIGEPIIGDTISKDSIIVPAAIPFVSRNPLDSIDRKSTRLNSSHVRISYAVFCLKKK